MAKEKKEQEEVTDEILATWDFPEHEKHTRGKWWYIIFAIVVAGFLIYSYFTSNPLFAVIVALFIIIYVLIERRPIRRLNIVLTEDGILLQNKFIEYETLENFYIIYYPPEVKNLYFQPKNILKPLITIPLEDMNPVEVREILLDFLQEDLEKEEMPGSEGISRILKL